MGQLTFSCQDGIDLNFGLCTSAVSLHSKSQFTTRIRLTDSFHGLRAARH